MRPNLIVKKIEVSEKPAFDTAKTLNPAKSQRNHQRRKLCAFAELLRFSGVNGPFHSFQINGFTLLEMIIALSIFTFLSVIMATVLSSALSAYRAATNKNEAMLQARTAMDWLVREIQSANDPANNLTENGASAITFNTPYLSGIRYFLNTTDPTNYIIQRRNGVGSSQNDTLSENVTRFNLQYYNITNAIALTLADVRGVEIYINTTRNGQNFEGYTTARFQP